MKVNLVCKGGGIKGIALVGALLYLEECGYTWDNLAGTSAGAIVVSLLAVGYTASEIKSMLYSLNLDIFKDRNINSKIPLINPFINFLIYKGINKGDGFEDFLNHKFSLKGKTKFKDVSVNGISKLKIIAADISRQKLLILPDDLKDYGINPMEFSIAKAVRMSMSIPIYFNPIIIKNAIDNKENINYIVDGGIVSNFPIWLFNSDNINGKFTFGLNLYDSSLSNYAYNYLNPFNYLINILQTSLITNEATYFKNEEDIHIINLPTLGIKTTQFNISKSQINDLFYSGYNTTKNFIQSQDLN